jgi:hypothetical protein
MHPFAAWRILLHPAQRKIAYAPRYAGPVQVNGGAGTGKPSPHCIAQRIWPARRARNFSREIQARPFCSLLLRGTWPRPLRRSSICS